MLSSPLAPVAFPSCDASHAPPPDSAVELEHVWKRYRRYNYRNLSLKGRALDWLHGRTSQFVEFDALRDVSFSVRRGESVAVLGRNGAGKSTLLKIIAGVVGPDSGTVNVCGHVSPLLALAAGFAPDLSGRRNTYLYGALLGMSRREVRTRLDSIVQFSEIGDFLDTPVKHYSTGMYVRLAFSIVAHLDPTILLVDEVLAVGDVGFQAKCLARIRELREVGKTLIVVTHGPQLAIDLCDRAILLDHGAVVADGDPDQVGAAYSTLVNQSL